MSFLVIAHPVLQQSDFDWVQEYRRQYDKQFNLVGPHFTIVFAIQGIDKESFVQEVRRMTDEVDPFEFNLKVATINQDNSAKYYHEFLVPDAGNSNIIKLHDRLYSGLFAPYQRFDVDFIPHISIGDSEAVQISKKRVDELNSQAISINGHFSSLDVIEYADGAISTVESIML